MRFLSLLPSRLALLRFELHLEKKRCTILIVLILFAVLATMLGIVFGAFFLIFYFWENRLLLLFSLSIFFLGLALLCFLLMPRFFKSTLFADSLKELQKDIAILKNNE